MTSIKPGPTKPPGYTCKKRVMMVEEVIYEESVKCEDIVEEECFPSYRTIYQPMKVEECETIFKKVCYIAFKNVAREKSVQICQEKKSRDCNLKGQETCTLEEETVCETFKDPTMRTSCQMKMERVCDYDYQGRPINCVQIPKRKCRGRQAKALDIGPPQTECYNFPRKICGPEVCPLVTVPNVCEIRNETVRIQLVVIQEIPDEECKMEPQKECRVVTKIVPKLDTQEDCVEVHKEICNNVRNPVKVRKPSIRTWCGIIPQETSMPKKELRTKLFVALGCDELENHITDVEIIALSNQNPPDFKMNLSSRIINDPSDFPHPSNSNPIGGFIGGKPWVCAGFHREGFCTFFNPEANKWEISLKLETLRSSPGSFVDEANDQLWITGGFSVKSNALLNSTEILVKGENIAQGPDLPLPLMAHCAVNVNSTHYMLIGGFGKSYSSTDQVHLVQKETGHSQEMDSLILGRVFHTCGKIESTRGPEIVVIGGISYDGLANHLPIEVFSLTTKNWRTEGVTSQNLTQVVSVEFNSTLLIVGGFSPDNIFELNKETFELMPRKEVLAQKKNSVVAMLIPDNFAYEIKAAKIEVPTNPMTVSAGFLFADATGFDEMKYFNPDSNDICPTRIPSRWDPYDLHASGFLMNGSPWICSKRLHNFPTVNCLKYDMEEQDWLPPTFIDFLFRTVRNPCQLTPNKVWITGGNPYVEYDEWDGTSVVIENGVFDNGPELPIHINNMQFVRVDENHFFSAVWDTGYTLPELISSEGNHFPGGKIESTPFLDCSSHICTSSNERCVICISTPQPTRVKVWQFQIPSLDGTELSFLSLEREVQDAKFIEVGADQLFLIVQDDVFDTFYLFDNNLREFKPVESIPSTSKSPLDIVGLLMESSPCVGGDPTPHDMEIPEPDATTIPPDNDTTTHSFN
eukprot:TCALIF_01782-PA protein Name:"Protein of unknown function" AED:0.35 eAED:0.23 QI:0/0.42/0.12/0.62/0.85/1/8/0/917